jgi:hypothetical protein
MFQERLFLVCSGGGDGVFFVIGYGAVPGFNGNCLYSPAFYSLYITGVRAKYAHFGDKFVQRTKSVSS